MQPANQNELQNQIETRLRTVRILWFALFTSVGFYYLLTIFQNRREDQNPNNVLFIALVVVALVITFVSFVIKEQFVRRAAEQQQPALLQQGYIVAWAFNEVPGLMGLFVFFATGNRYYFALFIISTCGQLLNFPRRLQVESAYFK